MPYKNQVIRNTYQRQYAARKRKEAKESKQTSAGKPPKGNPGDVVADWAESTLKVPTGPLRGQPFRISPWQRDFLRDALGPGVRESGLSVARKNGKSGLIAALALAYLVGPLNATLWRGIVVSLTGILAGELRDAIELTASASGLSGITVKKYPPPGTIEGLNQASLSILASDRATGHAVGADLAILDEAGLLQENNRDLWNAVLSSTSGRDGRMLSISIQGDGPMFSELKARLDSPSVAFHLYAAPDDCSLDDESAWEVANPGLADGIKSRGYMVDMAQRAIAIPSDAASFRAYDLNQPRNPSTEMICQVHEWQACERDLEELPPRSGDCVVGFDLGGSASLTALAAFWPETGRLEAWAACGDNPPLVERSRADGLGEAYCRMQERGELTVWPGRVTPVAQFLGMCAERLSDSRVVLAGADRYRQAEAEDALTLAGVQWEVEWRGQGASATADGSHDVRAFQRLVLGGRLAVVESWLLRAAISESVIRRDGAGNPAIDKRRERGRIDALSAAVIAAGLGEIISNQPPAMASYIGMVNP